ncbi:retrovirus-related pol polyprotein from transposon TNT 1-94 [Tanacetum coccineum]
MVYSRRPKAPKFVGSTSKSKIIESRISNQSEPTQTGESTVSNVPSSSLINCRSGMLPFPEFTTLRDSDTIFSPLFLRSKDEAPEFIIKFLKMIQVRLNATVRNIHTDNGTEFVNQTLRSYYEDVVATACYTQNSSLIRFHHGKTPYELLHDRKPNISYIHVFGALCYQTNDSEDLGKLKAKADVDFDELIVIASEQSNLGPALNEMTPGTLSSGLVPQPPSSTPFVPPTRDDWDTLLQPTSSLILVDQDAPSPSTLQTPQASASPVIPPGAEEADHDIEVVIPNNVHLVNQPPEHIGKWTKDHPIDNAPKAWYDLLSSFLLSQKFSKGIVDPTLFIKREGKDILLIIKKHGMETNDPMDTLVVEKSKLDADPQGKEVDPTHYRRMIGSLMYLTASRLDLQFADSCIELTAFVDANHASCQDTRRSMQLLGDRLVSWSSKKQKSTAISSKEAKYIALPGCCAQIL